MKTAENKDIRFWNEADIGKVKMRRRQNRKLFRCSDAQSPRTVEEPEFPV